MPAKSQNKPQGKKCTCNFGYMVIAWILFAVAIYVLISGIAAQFQGIMTWQEILLTYFIGVVILSLGKLSKWKGVGCCSSHK